MQLRANDSLRQQRNSHQQLGSAEVIEGDRLDSRHVNAHLAMNTAALDAQKDAEVRGKPRRFCNG